MYRQLSSLSLSRFLNTNAICCKKATPHLLISTALTSIIFSGCSANTPYPPTMKTITDKAEATYQKTKEFLENNATGKRPACDYDSGKIIGVGAGIAVGAVFGKLIGKDSTGAIIAIKLRKNNHRRPSLRTPCG